MKKLIKIVLSIVGISLLCYFVYSIYIVSKFVVNIPSEFWQPKGKNQVNMTYNEMMNTRYPAKLFFSDERAEMGEAIYQNDISKVKNLLSHGIDVNQLSKDNDGFTYLMYSIFLQDRFEITKVLLAAGADPNIVSTITFTAYHAEGISAANTPGVRSKLPLHMVASNRPIEQLKFLLEYGADPNQTLRHGNLDYSVLHEAANTNTGLAVNDSDQDSLKRIELLLQYGLDIKKQTQVEKIVNPLRSAYFSDHINTILFMIDQGADTTVCGKDLVKMIKEDLIENINSQSLLAKEKVLLDKLTELGY